MIEENTAKARAMLAAEESASEGGDDAGPQG
jgi:hypothetical protein